MDGTRGKRYAVVSCHVERLLDDAVWSAFAGLQRRRPGGMVVAALVRPPDAVAGEDEGLWLERARAAAAAGPLGHHTHWTSPTHARPSDESDPGERVRREAAWLRENGLRPTLFCGGGWYTDASVAEACADLGYVDCTPRARRPAYLPPDAPWAELDEPSRLELDGGRTFLSIPTTHTIGELARDVVRPSGPSGQVVHAYLHDTDLLDRRRRNALEVGLRLLRLRRRPSDLDALARSIGAAAPVRRWREVARGEGAGTAPQ